MEEKTLFKIALISSLLGILLILFITEKLDLGQSNISNLTNLSGKVKIKGYITSFKENPTSYFINLKDETGEIPILVFKENPLNLTKGMIIEVEGNIIEYQGKKEISAELIRI